MVPEAILEKLEPMLSAVDQIDITSLLHCYYQAKENSTYIQTERDRHFVYSDLLLL